MMVWVKGTVTRNTNVKYKSPISHGSQVMKVSEKYIKL